MIKVNEIKNSFFFILTILNDAHSVAMLMSSKPLGVPSAWLTACPVCRVPSAPSFRVLA